MLAGEGQGVLRNQWCSKVGLKGSFVIAVLVSDVGNGGGLRFAHAHVALTKRRSNDGLSSNIEVVC